MGLENPIHIAFMLIILLLVFGAKRLPEIGKSLGSGMRGFRDAIRGHDEPAGLTATAGAPSEASHIEPARGEQTHGHFGA